jgi:hypothetical protein
VATIGSNARGSSWQSDYAYILFRNVAAVSPATRSMAAHFAAYAVDEYFFQVILVICILESL